MDPHSDALYRASVCRQPKGPAEAPQQHGLSLKPFAAVNQKKEKSNGRLPQSKPQEQWIAGEKTAGNLGETEQRQKSQKPDEGWQLDHIGVRAARPAT